MANCKWQIEDATGPDQHDWGLAETKLAWQA
jgi:hypothetical protein